MRLLGAELLRARSRRSFVLLLVAGLLLTVVIATVSAWNSRPYSADETAQARTAAERGIARCEKRLDPQRCEERVVRWHSDRWREPVNERLVEDATVSLSMTLILVAAIAGATLVGGEFTSGSMSNLLLFEPRRRRVWTAKLVATGLIAVLWSALCVGAFVAAMTALGRSWDPELWGSEWLSGTTNLGIRCTLTVAGAAVIGAALTLALRSTLAVVGAVSAYVILVEIIARLVFPNQIAEYALSSRLFGVLRGRHLVENVSGDTYREIPVNLQDSALMLAGVCLVLCAVSLMTFRRRDLG